MLGDFEMHSITASKAGGWRHSFCRLMSEVATLAPETYVEPRNHFITKLALRATDTDPTILY